MNDPPTWISGLNDPPKIQRGKHSWIFVNRFSAPGGPDTAGDSDGGPGLDRYSAEFSAYNSLNWRNSSVRSNLNRILASHVNQFGYFSAGAFPDLLGISVFSSSVNPQNYSGTGSFYRVNRNTTLAGLKAWTVDQDPSTSPGWCEVLKSQGAGAPCQYDNYYVQHAIPSTDYGYAWIRKTFGRSPDFDPSTYPELVAGVSASDVGSWINIDFAPDQRYYGADRYDPIKGNHGTGFPSGIGSQWLYVDFAGMNSNIYDPIGYSEIKLNERFTPQPEFLANNGLDPDIWHLESYEGSPGEMVLKQSNTGSNWILKFAGAHAPPAASSDTSGPRVLTTVQEYEAPLTVIFDYCQGDFQLDETPDGYDLQLPEDDNILHFCYSTDSGATWLTQSTFGPSTANEGDTLVAAGGTGFIGHTVFFPPSSGSNIMFRWTQPQHWGTIDADSWGLDNVQIYGSSLAGNALGHIPFYDNGTTGSLSTDYTYQGGLIYAAGGLISGSAKILNGLILHRQGPYGWPSWKQTRLGEHPIVRYWDGNSRGDGGQHRNLFCYTTYDRISDAPSGTWVAPPPAELGSAHRYVPVNNCVSIPPLTVNYLAEVSVLVNNETEDGFVETLETSLALDFENNLGGFPGSTDMDNNLGVPSYFSHQSDTTAYSYLSSLYLPAGALSNINNPVSGFIEMLYRAPLYPSDGNMYTSRVRYRAGFENTFWKSKRTSRTILGEKKFPIKKGGS